MTRIRHFLLISMCGFILWSIDIYFWNTLSFLLESNWETAAVARNSYKKLERWGSSIDSVGEDRSKLNGTNPIVSREIEKRDWKMVNLPNGMELSRSVDRENRLEPGSFLTVEKSSRSSVSSQREHRSIHQPYKRKQASLEDQVCTKFYSWSLSHRRTVGFPNHVIDSLSIRHEKNRPEITIHHRPSQLTKQSTRK